MFLLQGWIYFHTGDRWFVNFWKGKADGEGRFYSKYGDVFFGHFKEGWRHGHFLRINVDGTRFSYLQCSFLISIFSPDFCNLVCDACSGLFHGIFQISLVSKRHFLITSENN